MFVWCWVLGVSRVPLASIFSLGHRFSWSRFSLTTFLWQVLHIGCGFPSTLCFSLAQVSLAVFPCQVGGHLDSSAFGFFGVVRVFYTIFSLALGSPMLAVSLWSSFLCRVFLHSGLFSDCQMCFCLGRDLLFCR